MDKPADPIELPDTPGNDSRKGSDELLVSVIVASYEAHRSRVQKLLNSIATQPYTNLEVVIVDSSNLDFLATTAKKTDWVQYVPSEPRGVSAGSNEAIDHANGDVIAVIDDDDYATEKRLVRAVEAIKDGADIVYGDVYDLNEETLEISYREAMGFNEPDQLWLKLFRFDGVKGSIPAGTVTFRAECVVDERFNEELDGGEDYHLWVRLFKKYEPAYIPEPLAVMRQHDSSLSSDPDMMYENRLQAIDLLCDRYPELRPYRQERRMLERYDYARHLMFNGRMAKARSIFFELLIQERYYRTAVMLAVSFLPFGRQRIVKMLDDLYTLVRV